MHGKTKLVRDEKVCLKINYFWKYQEKIYVERDQQEKDSVQWQIIENQAPKDDNMSEMHG